MALLVACVLSNNCIWTMSVQQCLLVILTAGTNNTPWMQCSGCIPTKTRHGNAEITNFNGVVKVIYFVWYTISNRYSTCCEIINLFVSVVESDVQHAYISRLKYVICNIGHEYPLCIEDISCNLCTVIPCSSGEFKCGTIRATNYKCTFLWRHQPIVMSH